MWEDLTVALCGVGFALAVAIVLIELRAVFSPLDAWMRAGAPMSPGGRRAFRMRVAHPRWVGWVRHRVEPPDLEGACEDTYRWMRGRR